MNNEIYDRLAAVLDTLPSGYPRTESGVEITLLKKVFTEEEASFFCDLKLTGETVHEIARRTGRPIGGMEELLTAMWGKGQILRDIEGDEKHYRLVPWVVGIFEFQIGIMDREFASMHREYMKVLAPPLFLTRPAIMQVVPVEREISSAGEALPYEQASKLLADGKAFGVGECICKMQSRALDRGCEKPHEVCLAIAGDAKFFEGHPMNPRVITKTEALEILKKAEDAGLIHMTGNVRSGHWYLCNCCSCCCFQLIAARKGIPGTVNSHYYAGIDPEKCAKCGTCLTRCQIKAIDSGEKANAVNRKKCIGCGLCVSTCPSGAARLFRKPSVEQADPPADDMDWHRERGRVRGVDFSKYE